jgi:hypothetical protein
METAPIFRSVGVQLPVRLLNSVEAAIDRLVPVLAVGGDLDEGCPRGAAAVNLREHRAPS